MLYKMDDKLTGLDPIPSVDRANDLMYIVSKSGGTSNSITPNALMGVSSNPVGISDSQTLTNKTISGSTNTLTNINPTNVTGLPSVSSIVTLTGTQTLSNKTLTSPTINNPTVSNASITANSVSGYTTANTGTIYGVGVTSGVITGANSVSGGAITSNSITGAKIQNTTIAYSNLDTSTFPAPFKIGTMTISATGTKAITGLSFKPKALDFYVLYPNSNAISASVVGSFDGTNYISVSAVTAASTRYNFTSTTAIRFIDNNGSGLSSFTVTSLDSDGFTLNVSENNSGPWTWAYKAYR